jgi:hypothetical protein
MCVLELGTRSWSITIVVPEQQPRILKMPDHHQESTDTRSGLRALLRKFGFAISLLAQLEVVPIPESVAV